MRQFWSCEATFTQSREKTTSSLMYGTNFVAASLIEFSCSIWQHSSFIFVNLANSRESARLAKKPVNTYELAIRDVVLVKENNPRLIDGYWARDVKRGNASLHCNSWIYVRRGGENNETVLSHIVWTICHSVDTADHREGFCDSCTVSHGQFSFMSTRIQSHTS